MIMKLFWMSVFGFALAMGIVLWKESREENPHEAQMRMRRDVDEAARRTQEIDGHYRVELAKEFQPSDMTLVLDELDDYFRQKRGLKIEAAFGDECARQLCAIDIVRVAPVDEVLK
jgi:hypothetical protein